MTDTAPAQAVNPFAKTSKKAAAAQTETAVETTAETPAMAPSAPVAKAPASAPLPGGIPFPGSGGMPAGGGAAPLPGFGQANVMTGPASILPDDMEIDLDGVSASSGGGGYIGPGRHLMYVTSVTQETSKAGNPMFVFGLTVASGEYAGKSKNAYVAYTPAALWKVLQVLEALGLYVQGQPKPKVGDVMRLSPGRVIIGEFVPGDPYNNRPSTDLQTFYPPTELGIEPGTTYQQLTANR